MEAKIAGICEIEAGLYLDYYNGKYEYEEFKVRLENSKEEIRDKIYDLLEEGYEEEGIIKAIKGQGEYYQGSPEWFSENDEITDFPSLYFETSKNKKYPHHERCGYTLSLIKRFFKTRKAIKAEHAYQKSKYNNLDDGMREIIYTHMRGMKKKKKKKKINTNRKKSKRRKSKRRKSTKKR